MVSRGVLVLLLVALVAGPLLLVPPPVRACWCTESSLEEQVGRAEVVVVGTLQETVDVDLDNRDLTIGVDEYLKGSGDSKLTVRDIVSDCSAFGTYEVGKQYLLFLSAYEGHFRTSVCDGSTAIHPDYAPTVAEEIHQIVAASTLPTDPSAAAEFPTSASGSGQSDGNRVWIITGVAVLAALGLVGAAAVVWRGALRW